MDDARAEGRKEGREEGSEEALRETTRELGRQRLGNAASRKQLASLAGIDGNDRLTRLRDRLLYASSWTDLLATP